MTEKNPEKWLIVKTPQCYKVFGVWRGSYLYGESWSLNSGITKVEEDGEYLIFHGHTDSVYRCHKGEYGTSSYGAGILDNILKRTSRDEFRILESYEQYRTEIQTD